MQNTHKKKICIVSRSLSEGGADRVASIQSIFLYEMGYEVFVVSILNSIVYPYKGILLNLGKLKDTNNTFLGRFNRFLKFKQFIRENKIELVIDHRVRSKPFSEYLISSLVYPKGTCYMVHNHTIQLYFPPFKNLTKYFYKKAKAIVCVSNGISRQVKETYGFKNIKTIYNAVDIEYIEDLKLIPCSFKTPFVFWYGRIEDEQKNLSLLIKAYNESQLPEKNIKLVLMGEGKDMKKIRRLILNYDLGAAINILPYSSNPFSYINQSLFTVLSSRYEGFPMTVLESLACGRPVVSVKYKNYEDGVVKHGYNGILVENENSKALANGLNILVNDKALYQNCLSNAKKSIEPYHIENIKKLWKNLIEN